MGLQGRGDAPRAQVEIAIAEDHAFAIVLGEEAQRQALGLLDGAATQGLDQGVVGSSKASIMCFSCLNSACNRVLVSLRKQSSQPPLQLAARMLPRTLSLCQRSRCWPA